MAGFGTSGLALFDAQRTKQGSLAADEFFWDQHDAYADRICQYAAGLLQCSAT